MYTPWGVYISRDTNSDEVDTGEPLPCEWNASWRPASNQGSILVRLGLRRHILNISRLTGVSCRESDMDHVPRPKESLGELRRHAYNTPRSVLRAPVSVLPLKLRRTP